MTKFVVVAGGVISGVGKGVTTASLGKILKEHGYKTTLIKIDPYINYDAGTLRPTEHGEVWVTADGGEIDQDLGTYERFIDEDLPRRNNITTGQVYKAVIDRERRGEYLGQTVQFIPHIPDEIIDRIKQASEGYEIAIIEIGGTVGDYENTPFLMALKTLEQDIGSDNVVYMLVSYLPIPKHIYEMKTKPTQQSIRLLNEAGIFPDFILCRAASVLDDVRRKKIERYANIPSDHVISAPDITTVYQIPLNFEREELGKKVLSHFGLTSRKEPDWKRWSGLVDAILKPKERRRIAIVGKYFATGDYSLTDSYVSIFQALVHAGAALDAGISITWIDAQQLESHPESVVRLSNFDGVIIPGGFGDTGVEGKLKAIEYLRSNNIPFLGLCYGLQLAVVEYARNKCDMKNAHTTEVDPHTPYPVIDVLPTQREILEKKQYGGTMRLGNYQAALRADTKVYQMYDEAKWVDAQGQVTERHRHRYEVNPRYVDVLEKQGLCFSGYHLRDDGTKLMEYLEIKNHPFFVATQAHPEFRSRLGNPNPIFMGFVRACLNRHQTATFMPSTILQSYDDFHHEHPIV